MVSASTKLKYEISSSIPLSPIFTHQDSCCPAFQTCIPSLRGVILIIVTRSPNVKPRFSRTFPVKFRLILGKLSYFWKIARHFAGFLRKTALGFMQSAKACAVSLSDVKFLLLCYMHIKSDSFMCILYIYERDSIPNGRFHCRRTPNPRCCHRRCPAP